MSNLTKEEYRELISECVSEAIDKHHKCVFNSEELQVLKDFISFGKMFKKGILQTTVIGILGLTFLVGFTLYSVFK